MSSKPEYPVKTFKQTNAPLWNYAETDANPWKVTPNARYNLRVTMPDDLDPSDVRPIMIFMPDKGMGLSAYLDFFNALATYGMIVICVDTSSQETEQQRYQALVDTLHWLSNTQNSLVQGSKGGNPYYVDSTFRAPTNSLDGLLRGHGDGQQVVLCGHRQGATAVQEVCQRIDQGFPLVPPLNQENLRVRSMLVFNALQYFLPKNLVNLAVQTGDRFPYEPCSYRLYYWAKRNKMFDLLDLDYAQVVASNENNQLLRQYHQVSALVLLSFYFDYFGVRTFIPASWYRHPEQLLAQMGLPSDFFVKEC